MNPQIRNRPIQAGKQAKTLGNPDARQAKGSTFQYWFESGTAHHVSPTARSRIGIVVAGRCCQTSGNRIASRHTYASRHAGGYVIHSGSVFGGGTSFCHHGGSCSAGGRSGMASPDGGNGMPSGLVTGAQDACRTATTSTRRTPVTRCRVLPPAISASPRWPESRPGGRRSGRRWRTAARD
jgi:hypothetical protein